MDRNGSSWAENWDYNHHRGTAVDGGGGGGGCKYTKKLGEGLGKFGEGFAKIKAAGKLGDGFSKTRVAASTGFKKVKGGASVGLLWIKNRCHKTTHK